jgi:hypothetical protein
VVGSKNANSGSGKELVRDLECLLPTPTATRGRNETARRTNPDSTHHAGTTLEDVAWRLSGKASTDPLLPAGSQLPGQLQLPLTTETVSPFLS